MVCPLCLNCALDPLGYNCVTCKRGGAITTRCNTLRNVVYSTFQQAGLSAHLEIGCRWSNIIPGHDQQISLLPIGIVGSAAFDITVAYPLNSINMLEAGMYRCVSAKAPEHRKHTENDPKCIELGWRCIQVQCSSRLYVSYLHTFAEQNRCDVSDI